MWNWGHGTAKLSQTLASDFPITENRSFSAEKVGENGEKFQKMGGKWENGKCHINKQPKHEENTINSPFFGRKSAVSHLCFSLRKLALPSFARRFGA